jgi:tetratricopeptide (TPR) repeat protein
MSRFGKRVQSNSAKVYSQNSLIDLKVRVQEKWPHSKNMPDTLPPIPVLCAACKAPQATVQETMPLCVVCRDKHSRLNIPTFLKIGATLIAIVLIYTAVRLPREVEASIAWDRGEAASDTKNYTEAERDYEAALRYFPQSTVVLGRLAIAAHANGDNAKFNYAMDALSRLAKTDPTAANEMADVLMEGQPRKP